MEAKINTDKDIGHISVSRKSLEEQIKRRQDYKDWLDNGNGTKDAMKHFRRKPFEVKNLQEKNNKSR